MNRVVYYVLMLVVTSLAAAQEPLTEILLEEPLEDLARQAIKQGDPAKGAVLFHQALFQCSKCHAVLPIRTSRTARRP